MRRTASQTLFAHVVTGAAGDIELDVAALLLGDWERESTDIAHYTELLDRWAARADQLAADGAPADGTPAPIAALNQLLYEELGFRGNDTDYYDRHNNFLADVIERRTGMPIALSVLYVELARRMGIAVHGVGFPGHFLVRYDGGSEPRFLDPFDRGAALERSDLQRLLRRAVGDRVPLTRSLLQPTGNRQILFRMLVNLASTYSREGDVGGCVEALERMHILMPERPGVAEELERLYRRLRRAN